MKTKKAIYWISTAMLSAAFLMSSIIYLSRSPQLVEGFKALGLPFFMIPLLGTAKLLGSLALLNPWSARLREWAYAGFAFTLMGAIWAHVATSTPFIAPLAFLAVLVVSLYFDRSYRQPNYRMIES